MNAARSRSPSCRAPNIPDYLRPKEPERCASASYVGPYLIEDFVNFLLNKRNQRLQSGYLLALGFLGAKVVETISQRQWIFGARQLGLRLRAALISHVYQKRLHLSSQTRQGRTIGEIINYMSVDIQRVTDILGVG
ncbi:hypothetical protein MLD38_035581 [Melastoma candidum]|uniref:Uncharacterized protein n=1 Tax=Melastoma candidum TaxID=119954 RepID=A0ACB9LGM2_9MYRT|nr:hypothetical protein MLD38_035581 [Melastoma candidum]